jgi:8-amino-7-oxononanoate synthase
VPDSPALRTAAAAIEAGLADLDARNLRRSRRVLDSPQGPRVRVGSRLLLNFSNNDYLGLADHPRLREAAHAAIDRYGVGAGASPLVSGHLRSHAEAEERFAAFVGQPRALLFASGYAANLGILAALGGRDVEVFSDALNHACLVDGARLSRGKVTVYPHGDVDALAAFLAASAAPRKIVAADAVFSMDGDIAPVAALAELCERHDAWLVLDDAHGIGVLGARGRGTLDHLGVRSARIVCMATLGKALGGYGAFVTGASPVVEWLLQRARTYIYSTALPPAAAAVATAAIGLLESDGTLVERLHARIAELRRACAEAALGVVPSATAIHPLVVGTAEAALAMSRSLEDAGFLVPAIRPPTVPEGTSRLRISLSAAHASEEVRSLVAALARCRSR